MALNWQSEYHRYRRYFTNVGQLYKKKNVRVYTEIILSIVTISFFLFFAIKPTVLTITGLIRQIKDQRVVAEKLGKKINALSQAQNQYLSIEPDFYLINQALPTDTQASLLIKELEALARRSGVTLKAVQFNKIGLKEKNLKSEQKEINFNITASGDYQRLKEFLTSFNLLRRVVIINSFSFQTEKESKNLSLNLKAKTFYYPQTEEVINEKG